MIKGKVVDAQGKPVVGAKIAIEFTGGVNRKMDTKTDKKGEFIQIGLQSGAYKVTATDEKLGTQTFPAQVRVGQTQEVNFVLAPGAGGPGENPKAVELKKLFEEGVTASRANNHDVAIEKFNAAALIVPNCHDCYYNIGFAYLQKKDEKQAEAAWLKALEIKPDYAEALNGLATLYNNQKRFDEATAMSAKAAAGRRRGRQRRRGLQPGHHPLEPGQDCRGQGQVRRGARRQPESSRIELPVGNGAAQRGQDAGSHRVVREIFNARARRASLPSRPSRCSAR